MSTFDHHLSVFGLVPLNRTVVLTFYLYVAAGVLLVTFEIMTGFSLS
jgi:hypothetical protein